MCLAVPARVIECLEGDRALIDLEGVRMDISLELLDDVRPGDYVIVHVGYAIGKLDEDEALATLQAMAAMAQADAREGVRLGLGNRRDRTANGDAIFAGGRR